METIVIHLPDTIQTDAFEVKMLVAGALYERGKLSAGQASELVGLSKSAFIELLGSFGFSAFGYSADEVAEDLQRAAKWAK